MEVAISAISGEILSRLISFLIKKHADRACLEEKLERLKHLLLRVHTVVEEAEGRYITNSCMLVQLRMIVDGMYQGYHVLDTIRFKPFDDVPLQNQVINSLSLSAPVKRTRATSSAMKTTMSVNHELQALLPAGTSLGSMAVGNQNLNSRKKSSHPDLQSSGAPPLELLPAVDSTARSGSARAQPESLGFDPAPWGVRLSLLSAAQDS